MSESRNSDGTYHSQKVYNFTSKFEELKPHKDNWKGDFIHGYYIDEKVCDDVIEYFNEPDPEKQIGVYGNADEPDLDKKDSTDLYVHPTNGDPRIRAYLDQLAQAVKCYTGDFPALNNQSPWHIDTLFNLQHYKPGGGFKVWHHERDAYAVQNRMLVFMTFLNTVTDQGGTEFKYQKRIVNAEKGLTVFWPTDYTHIHRGVVSPTQDKYIATGWYHFRGPFEFQDENGEKRIFDGRNIR